MQLVVVHSHTAHSDVLSVVGDLDLASAPRLVTHAAEALRRGARRLVLDLRAVDFVDSAGLAALLNVLRRTAACDAALVLADLQPQARRLLADTRMDRQFTIVDRVEQADPPAPAGARRRGAR